MTGAAETAFGVAERIGRKTAGPWDVFGERVRRFEVHLNGAQVEMVRGPVLLEGYGVRLLRPRGEETGVGFAASTDLSAKGVAQAVDTAETTSELARFPARHPGLPGPASRAPSPAKTVDERLWERPLETLEKFVATLQSAMEGHKGAVPSFGSLRASLAETSLANSEGVRLTERRTLVDFEYAVKASDGPEGPDPGEYWVNRRTTRLVTQGVEPEVADWCRKAEDVRHAAAPPTGTQNVVFPAGVLADFLPEILGYRFSGAAELRHMAPAPGSRVGTEGLTITDDGRFPYGLASGRFDDEGNAKGKHRLVEAGVAAGGLYDALHANALSRAPTGSGLRDSLSFAPWFHFTRPPGPNPNTLVIAPGDGGRDEELAEAVGEGIWVDQLGYAFPDPFSAAYGGELRVAYRIHRGKLAGPVRGGVVGGVVLGPPGEPSTLASVTHVGSKATLVGRLSSPTLVVGGMSVGGA